MLYWVFEYAKVLFCYIFVMFIWPSVVFRKYLHNKSRIFRFCFCSTAQTVLITTVVLLLGIGYLLNAWVVNALFYGTFLISLAKLFWPDSEQKQELRRLASGTLKLRYFMSRRFSDIRKGISGRIKKIWDASRSRRIEYALLFVVVGFGVIYFSYAALQDHSYGFGDMYTHHLWIYGLIQGKAFSAGVYPEGMHCVIYLMHTVSGITVFSCNLFLGGIHSFVILLSAYCLMREVFRSRYIPTLVLAAYLFIAVGHISEVVSISRLQRTLPLEYGMHTQFLCALFLLRFLKENLGNLEKDWQKNWGWLRNENLIMLCMSLAASIAIHFYATMMAFFICLPFAIIFIKRIFAKERFKSLAAAVVCGVMIAVLPMGLALISGIPFQGSINWALEVMQGTDEESADIRDSLSQDEEDDDIIQNMPNEGEEADAPGAEDNITLEERLVSVWVTVKEKIYGIYQTAYCTLYGKEQGSGMVFLSLLLIALWLLYRVVCKLICMLFHITDPPTGIYDSYIPIIIGLFIFMAVYSAPFTGLPILISYIRVCATEHFLFLMVAAMPIDIIFSLLHLFCAEAILQAVPAACTAALYAITIMTGNFHGYMYNELTRYNSVVDVTANIIQSFPENTYTIISSTDDLYQVIEYGRHEELLDFLKLIQSNERYYIPTEYVFIYVEKRPIGHAQTHFSSGPLWLATDTYADVLYKREVLSKCPEIISSSISEDYAEMQIPSYAAAYDAYKDMNSRTIINAKVNKWCEAFADIYKNEMMVYYEDDDFICYCFKQNTYSLYNLAIDY